MRRALLATVLFAPVAVDPVLAASTATQTAAGPGTAFCQTAIAETIKNLFTIIQFGGPLVGGVIALGATVATPTIRRADLKKELKAMRNQALVWGVIVAPLGTAILQFLLNNVVAGGASCSF
jgi:hypothetical protein